MIMSDTYTDATFAIDDNGVALFTMNRPDILNALTDDLKADYVRMLDTVQSNDAVKALIITGTGRAFSAGGNVKAMGDPERSKPVNGRSRILQLHDWLERLHNLDCPVIAAVDGMAFGGGLALALQADFILASEGAKFCSVFGRIGLVPDMAVLYALPRAIGMQKAKELMFTARSITAREAEALDLLYAIYPAQDLLPAAGLIALVGFVESVSVAKALASKRRQKIDADQELRALGVANIGAAFSGGYPVTGGFSRSMVNFTAGANTGLAAIVTAILIAFTLAFLTPLFHYLPKAALAAIIVVAVSGLVDFRSLFRIWRYNGLDGFSQLATFAAVLALGIEIGIMLGAALSIAFYLWRTSRPHMAIVGRVGETEHFRNILRHDVKTLPHVLALRVDENLYFANTRFLEDRLLAAVADQPRIKHLVLICSAINFIDASALESLENTVRALSEAGVTVHLAEVKGPVMDKLEKTDFLGHLGAGEVFLSTHDALAKLEKPLDPGPVI